MTADFRRTLRLLVEAKADFILVGGLSAVVRGMPVLEQLDAVFRIQPQRRLRPNESHLAGRGHINLITTGGSLDLLCTIGQDLTYEDLLPFSDELELGDNLTVRVLKLEKLIELKEQLNGEKDRAMLAILRRTVEETAKRTPPPRDS